MRVCVCVCMRESVCMWETWEEKNNDETNRDNSLYVFIFWIFSTYFDFFWKGIHVEKAF